jgi:hypothetical protein
MGLHCTYIRGELRNLPGEILHIQEVRHVSEVMHKKVEFEFPGTPYQYHILLQTPYFLVMAKSKAHMRLIVN